MAKPYRVERSRVIAAAPSVVFELVAKLREWPKWSPWEGLDPALERTYSGPESGVGSAYAWSGNRKAGRGSITVRTHEPGRAVVFDLVFEKPFASRSESAFRFEPESDGTRLTWTMTGEQNWFVATFLNMDKLIGKDFERGLERLAAAVSR